MDYQNVLPNGQKRFVRFVKNYDSWDVTMRAKIKQKVGIFFPSSGVLGVNLARKGKIGKTSASGIPQ